VNSTEKIMAKQVVGTRIEPELKREIEEEAQRKDRKPAWLLERLIELGWKQYQRKEQKA
jgi:hypothetical protein